MSLVDVSLKMAKGKSSNQKDIMKEGILEHEKKRKKMERAEKLDYSNLAGGSVKQYRYTGRQTIFYKTLLTITIGPSHCALGHYPREMKN